MRRKTRWEAAQNTSTRSVTVKTSNTFVEILLSELLKERREPVAAHFVTTARFVTKVTKRVAMPARFVSNEVVTNRAGIAPFFSHLDISTCDIVSVTYVCVCVRACLHQREREKEREKVTEREI